MYGSRDRRHFSSRFRAGESRAYGGEGGRMIGAIGIGIVIILAVIVATLAIVYFILRGTR